MAELYDEDSITRREGYARAAGNEGPALAVAVDFFRAHGMEPTLITNPRDNYLHGDLRFRSATVEVKGQPIDPQRYARNLVEVLEDTTQWARAHHRDGFLRTAKILAMSPDVIAGAVVRHGRQDRAGHIEYVSASLTSIAGSFATVYVNADAGHLYLYSSAMLLAHVRRAIIDHGLHRGRGNSNDVTLAVFVAVPNARWQRVEGRWAYGGPDGREPTILKVLRDRLGA